jgi:hypothetical protein
MAESFEKRLEAAEKAYEAKHHRGPRLTREPMILGGSPKYHAAVADGTVENQIVIWPDEPGPENPIL